MRTFDFFASVSRGVFWRIVAILLAADVLDSPDDAETLERVRAQVAEPTRRFPVYG
ncbi:hypothetical protein [Burkholderia pyrrocinia]|uniref:hypothetical protein n=1 Tax=Burkholderia pyrrocinia TaxID=60550 RepID=UPI00158DC1AB|nr:hypothetical protein [Burkholderia pyrrocinia]